VPNGFSVLGKLFGIRGVLPFAGAELTRYGVCMTRMIGPGQLALRRRVLPLLHSDCPHGIHRGASGAGALRGSASVV